MIWHAIIVLACVWLFASAALVAFLVAGYLFGNLRPPHVPSVEEANVMVHGSRHARNELRDRRAS
jgi:hypothetical protein